MTLKEDCISSGDKNLNRTLIAWTLRFMVNQWDLRKLNSFCKEKDNINWTKKQPTEWEKKLTLSDPSSQKARTTGKRRSKDYRSQRGWESRKKNSPPNQKSRVQRDWIDNMNQSVPGHPCIYYGCYLAVFDWHLTVETAMSLTFFFFTFSCNSFLPTVLLCLASIWRLFPWLAVSSFVLFVLTLAGLLVSESGG